MVNLDLYDRKLIYELDKHSNLSLQQLAKKLRRSKPFVLYRQKRLEEQGIIIGYNAIVDMSKLGYFSFRVYFKFRRTTEQDGERFVQFILKHYPQVWTITSMHGKWDYALFLGVKTILEFHTIWDGIMLEYKPNIKQYNVAVYAPVYNFNRQFLVDTKEERLVRIYGAGGPGEGDGLDWKIIQLYASFVRPPAVG